MIFGWFNSSQQHLSEEQLSAYVDGSSDAPSEDRVLQHLANCDATCGADLEGLRTTVHILKSIAPVAAPRSFALTAEMVADLPDGKPLGEPPAPIRSSAWRTPVLVPAAASIAAAVVFALVLVGNLSGVIEQSGSSSDDTAVIATGIGGDVDVIVEEVVVEMAVAAPVAADATVQEPSAAPEPLAGDSLKTESAASGDPQRTTRSDAALVPPAAAPAPQVDLSERALAPAPKADPDMVTRKFVPQFESPEDVAVEDSQVLELPQVELFDTGVAATATALESLPIESIGQAVPQVLPGSLPAPLEPKDDDLSLPVWQLLLATGILTALLGAVSFQLSRRNIPG